ncbi:MAG: FAD-binding protein, partial [Paramuribaculum sp.]|nr:FAD-binding protein [Paramuribaculum sp.]
HEATLIGDETRTSAPVRIPRNDLTMPHINLDGLYPCGEGAGYAGGIVSAAIDGIRSAMAVSARLHEAHE